MKEKLTLEHIAPYLPYGLFAQWNKSKPFEIKGFQKGNQSVNNELWTWFDDKKYFTGYLYECKPILRPMDLTKPVTIDGKEVIPILELAKMRFHNYEWQMSKQKYVVCGEGAFEYSEKGFYYWATDGEVGHIPNQIGLFKWLYANKFDVEGLIDAGIAIDVNTLEINPYE